MATLYDKLGNNDDVPIVDRNARPDTSRVTPGDWSVLGRINGKRTIVQLAYESGMDPGLVIESLTRLKEMGMIHLLSEQGTSPAAAPVRRKSPPPAARSKAAGGSGPRSSVRVPLPQGWPIAYEDFTFDPMELDEGLEIDLEKQRQVIYFHYHLGKVTHYMLFQTQPDAADRQIRKAYFKLSKEFHPDLYFRKNLGNFKKRLEEVFRWIAAAYEVLSDRTKRQMYDQQLQQAGLIGATNNDTGDTADHLTLGKEARTQGNLRRALHFFRAGIQRKFGLGLALGAAQCLLELREDLDEAERLCKRAIHHNEGTNGVEALLTLAAVYEATDQPEAASRMYEQVKQIQPDFVVGDHHSGGAQ